MTQQYVNGAAVESGAVPARPVKRNKRRRPPEQSQAPVTAPTVVINPTPPPPPPVQTFQTGAVETCVWMNPTTNPAHPCVFSVSQSRLFPAGGEVRHTHSLRLADLDAARWGLYRAQKWIRKAERRGALLRLFGR
jgi:hypothetical protein